MITITTYDTEPLASLFKKYGFANNGETNLLVPETSEHEGDIYLPDLISDEYETDRKELEGKEFLNCYNEQILPSVTNEILDEALREFNIEKSSIEFIFGFLLSNEEFTESYFIGYQIFTKSGEMKFKSFKLE